jgi:hypothetical protein
MRHLRVIRAGKTWGQPMLGLLLALLLLVLGIGAAAHAARHANDPAHHTCATCSLAHGNFLADGAAGTTVVCLTAGLMLVCRREFVFVPLSDMRLEHGRAPPV